MPQIEAAKPFEPEAIENITLAFSGALKDLKIQEADSTTSELVARYVMRYAKAGVRDSNCLRQMVVCAVMNDRVLPHL